MPAIKLKKVTAEYLAEKEREEKSKDKSKKTLEDVAEEENAEKKEVKKDEENSKTHNFLDVEILSDKRKRTAPVVEQKLVEWYVKSVFLLAIDVEGIGVCRNSKITKAFYAQNFSSNESA